MLRPRRSNFHTTSVSPFPRVLSTRFSPGRSEVFPLILSSNISSHPAHSSAVRCNAVFWSFVDTLTYPISMVLSPAKGRKHATGELDGHSQKCWFCRIANFTWLCGHPARNEKAGDSVGNGNRTDSRVSLCDISSGSGFRAGPVLYADRCFVNKQLSGRCCDLNKNEHYPCID